ncbi:coatamer protein, beta subunit, putative [Plasmodium ovale wallikeri]|uniref:Coatamer protein, beta subunit, putative n=1 Tax=Plasmodium ovale wallikeri TaxID=864142 RepID=A0A1A8ZMN4_PLAOA|nr:coatamer protein, beta subunit, putative [Plasmodium ovale wallikeri]
MTIVERFMPLEYYEKETKNKPENDNISPIDVYISYISTLEDLQCLVNNSAFFAVNLFSRSVFGEDSLANLSIQKNPDGKLTGSIRVRSRTQVRSRRRVEASPHRAHHANLQHHYDIFFFFFFTPQGIALSLGDKITLVQTGITTDTH